MVFIGIQPDPPSLQVWWWCEGLRGIGELLTHTDRNPVRRIIAPTF